MSKRVIDSISTRKGEFSGNVKEVKTTTTTVADKSDLDALEARLNQKIATMQQSIDKLEKYLEQLSTETAKLPQEIKNEVLKLASQQKMVLDNEYKKIVDDMAMKCDAISSVLKQ